MVRIRTHKSNFTSGEISQRLLGRGDLTAYANGASALRNVFIHATGGVTRRSGLRYIETALGKGRLIAFEFNNAQVYLMVFTDTHVTVFRDGVEVADFVTPWTEAQIKLINWTQSADTLLIVHPDMPPKKILRQAEDTWEVKDWTFVEEDEDDVHRIYQPHHKFADDDVTVTPSATSGTITLTSSADVFVSDHVGLRFRVGDKEVEITSYTSATSVQASVKETLGGTSATKDWEEQAFSAVRGWPGALCFHQDRMVIGGSRDEPNRLWLSKSSDLFNFDLGEGLDDEAIEFAILSDAVNAVRAVFSGRHLQVLTSGAEWMVTGDPLTPGNMQLQRQTRIGSPVDRFVPPRDVDGATLFVPRSGPELREFLFADVEQAYQAADLAVLARHLIDTPQDQDFNKINRHLHLVMLNGSMATLTLYRAEQVTAWALQETDGNFLAVAVVGDDTYVMVERDTGIFIEVFDETIHVDSGLKGSDATGKDIWSGLSHLEGETVRIQADGSDHGTRVVSSGQVQLDYPAKEIQIGLAFSHKIEPQPPALQDAQGSNQGGKLRPISMTFRLKDTAALLLNTGTVFNNIPFKRFGPDILDAPQPSFTGDKKIRAFGWRRDGTDPLWLIEQDTPLPFMLLSVTTELSING